MEQKNIKTEAIVHPLVLLSAADHYNRVAKDSKKRVVGVLLGKKSGNTVDITNSFGVPFEEDLKKPDVWFLDHNFLETMFWMFKKVNTREDIVGFYSTSPKVKSNDLKIDKLIRQFCTDPVFVIIDVRPGVAEVPTTAYESVEEVQSGAKEIERVFKHISCRIEAEEAEGVGVEHLLRDINDPSTSTLAKQIKEKVSGLNSFVGRLEDVRQYLENVIDGKMPVNNQINSNLQNILNLLPNLNVEALVRSMLVKTNDMHLAMYLAALVRSVLALHDLLNNKIQFKDVDDVLDKNAGVEQNKTAADDIPSLARSPSKTAQQEGKEEGKEEGKKEDKMEE
jgi:26S proteasome regulatory subunit N8